MVTIMVTVTLIHKERQFVSLSLSKSMSLSSLTYRITPNRFIICKFFCVHIKTLGLRIIFNGRNNIPMSHFFISYGFGWETEQRTKEMGCFEPLLF